MVVVLGIVWVCENGERRARKERWGSFVILGCYKGARRNRLSLRGVSFGQRASKMANLRFGQKCKFAYLHARQNQNWHFCIFELAFLQISTMLGHCSPKPTAAKGLTVDEVEELRQAFDLFDTDGSSTIDPKVCFHFESFANELIRYNTFAFFRSFELQCKAWVLRRRIKPSIKW